jgi:hypothetical protein
LGKIGIGEEGLEGRGLVGGEGALHVGKEVWTFCNGVREVAWGGAWTSAGGTLGVHVEGARSFIEGVGCGGLGVCWEVEAHETGAEEGCVLAMGDRCEVVEGVSVAPFLCPNVLHISACLA